MREFHAIVEGKVQGVFFRAWTRDAALDLGLTGWVRNVPDGSVEVLAQGEEDVLGRFQSLLHDGPPLSRVTGVRVQTREPSEYFQGFVITR